MDKNFITSGKFAKICNTSKETLRHYKDIGLLIPKYTGENGYQYYDIEQFYDYYAIAIFKKTGTPLSKIKESMTNQNIPSILNTLKEQQEALEKEKRKIEQMQFLVKNSIINMSMGLSDSALSSEPQIAFFKKEHLLAVPHNEFHINKDEQDNDDRILVSVLQKYKELCDKFNVQTDYQLGAIMEFDDKKITHIYTRVDKAYKIKYYMQKPAGKYLYIIQSGNWNLKDAYQNLFSYIKNNRIKIVGDIYSYDLAGFMINSIEKNSMTMISVQID